MEIKSTIVNRSGQAVDYIYRDIQNEQDIAHLKIRAVHGYCFDGDKLVVVYSPRKKYWTPPGGGVEEGEDVSTALAREVKEETNMKVSHQRLIGYVEIHSPDGVVYHTRSVCIVEPYGPFESDPDGDITEIKSVDPEDFKKYIEWGDIGDHLINRALEIKSSLSV